MHQHVYYHYFLIWRSAKNWLSFMWHILRHIIHYFFVTHQFVACLVKAHVEKGLQFHSGYQVKKYRSRLLCQATVSVAYLYYTNYKLHCAFFAKQRCIITCLQHNYFMNSLCSIHIRRPSDIDLIHPTLTFRPNNSYSMNWWRST